MGRVSAGSRWGSLGGDDPHHLRCDPLIMGGTAARSWTGARTLAVLETGGRDLAHPPAGAVPGLDFLRTLAILLVVSTHYCGDFSAALGHGIAIGRLPLFYFGWTGVDLFFVLSGYLIGRQLWRELVASGTIDVPRFLVRRGLRIWPFYFVFLAWLIVTTSDPLARFVNDALFVSNYFPGNVSGGWSLSIEEQFYVCVPLLLLLLQKTGIRVRHQVVVIVGLLAVLPVIRWFTLHAYPGPVTADLVRRLVVMPIHTHADGLLAGVLIAWLTVCAPTVLAGRTLLRNLPLPIGLAASGLLLRRLDPELFALSGLALVFSAAVIFALRDRSVVLRFTRLRVFYVLSRLSYGMYLNHFGIVLFGAPIFAAMVTSIGLYPAFFLGYALTGLASVFVSACTFLLIESPFLQLREKWLLRRAAHVVAVPPATTRAR
jgi:peptidoglycan/LPS O-acetylase OafA/YrhL